MDCSTLVELADDMAIISILFAAAGLVPSFFFKSIAGTKLNRVQMILHPTLKIGKQFRVPRNMRPSAGERKFYFASTFLTFQAMSSKS